MKMKKLIAAILCLALACSLVTVPAMAASADLKSDTVLTEATVGGKKGITVDWKLTTGSSKLYGANITYAFDTSVFDLVDANGAVQTPVAGTACNAAQLNDGGGTAVWNLSADLFYEPGVADGTALVTIVRSTMGEYAAPTTATVGQFHLAYKDGKSAADVYKNTLREATPEEANAAGQTAVVLMGDMDGFTDVVYGAVSGTDTTGFESHVTFGKDFNFAKYLDTMTLSYTPAAVTVKAEAQTATPTLTATDNEGNTGYAPKGLKYTLAPATAGVTINETSGVVTVTKDAPVGTKNVTVTAAAEGKTATATIAITKDEPALDKVVIEGDESVVIPVGNQSDAVKKYTPKPLDQYENAFTTNVTLALDGAAPAGVSFDAAKGELKVTKDAKPGKVKLIATVNGAKKGELTVTLTNMEITWPTVELTYGDKASDVAKKATATATANGATITGKLTAADTVVPFDAKEIAVTFEATAPADYAGVKVEGKLPVKKVNKKAITVTAGDAKVTYTYAVAADTLTWTVTGLVGSDKKDDIKVTLTPAYTAGTTGVGEYAINGTGTAEKYTVTVTAGKLTVEPKSIALVAVTAKDVAYTGEAAKPAVTAKDGAATLAADKDFTVACTDVNAGAAEATVSGKGNYTGSVKVPFQITKVDVTGKTPVITGSAKVGKTVTVEIEGVVDPDKEMTFEWTYTVGDDTAVVEGATGASLELTSDLVGASLTVKATAKGINYVGTTGTSEAVTVSRAGGRPSSNRGDSSSSTSSSKLPFVDVAETDWFYKDVEAAYKNKLMNGTDETHFSPDLTTSRAMIATILWRVAGEPEARVKIADFPDVEGDSWYIKAVRWAAEQEIVKGFETGNFGPNENITREQLAAMLYRYNNWKKGETEVKGDLTAFADGESVSDWAEEAVIWATKEGIITGKPGSLLDPQGTATRAEAVTMLQRYVTK